MESKSQGRHPREETKKGGTRETLVWDRWMKATVDSLVFQFAAACAGTGEIFVKRRGKPGSMIWLSIQTFRMHPALHPYS